ncbi:MAG: hypothetical protein HEP71_11150 [Roseivirga sp.]|nr:hypothetical protein [Roseivirga sp.]
MTIEYPIVSEKRGSGIFQTQTHSFQASFLIQSYPHGNIIFTDTHNIALSAVLAGDIETWKLKGQLINGVKVSAEHLYLTKLDDKCRFFASREIHFGNISDKITKAEFPLFGISGNFSLGFDNKHIELHENDTSEKSRQIEYFWDIQQETSWLSLTSKSSIKRDDFIKLAITLCEILSLATGNTVTFNRQKFETNNGRSFETWRRRVQFHSGSGSIIHSVDYPELIKCSLASYATIEGSARNSIRKAIDYLNSTSHGFMEDKILRACQAWELLADEFCEKPPESEEIKRLKTLLKASIKTWSQKYPDKDKSEVSDRVLGSLSWNRLILQMKELAASEHLDLQKLDLDLFELKKMRDQVAHTGIFNNYSEKKEFYPTLKKAVMGLRLIILLKLTYTGNIKSSKDGFQTRELIEKFVNKDITLTPT